MRTIEIKSDSCRKCGLCARSCVCYVFEQAEPATVPEVKAPGACIECGHCISVCPSGSVIHSELDNAAVRPVKMNISPDDMEEFLSSKRSIRNFRDKPVATDIVERLIIVASKAPSDANSQERVFLVVSDAENINKMESDIIDGYRQFVAAMEAKGVADDMIEVARCRFIIKSYENGAHPVFKKAPCVIFAYGPENNNFSWYNCAAAMDYLMLQAHSMGLGSCVIGKALYEPEHINGVLEIPEGSRVYSAVTLGYPVLKYAKSAGRRPADIKWL